MEVVGNEAGAPVVARGCAGGQVLPGTSEGGFEGEELILDETGGGMGEAWKKAREILIFNWLKMTFYG